MTTKSDWWTDGYGAQGTCTVLEGEKPQPVVIYDHTGQPYWRPRQPIGFDLSRKRSQ